jgi:hypothetical protein
MIQAVSPRETGWDKETELLQRAARASVPSSGAARATVSRREKQRSYPTLNKVGFHAPLA